MLFLAPATPLQPLSNLGGFSYCHRGFAVQEKIVGGISARKKLTFFHVTMRKLVQLANASQADS